MQAFHSMLVKIANTARKVLSADRVTLFMHDAKTDELWSAVLQHEEVREIRIPSNEGLAGAAFQTGQIINVADAEKDARFRKDIEKKSDYICNSMLCMPITSAKGTPIGAIEAINKMPDGTFTADDEEQLKKFVAEVSHVLGNDGKWMKLLPGLAIVCLVAIAAFLLHGLLPGELGNTVGVVLVAIVLGLIIRNVFVLPVAWEPGIKFALYNMLRFAIVLLGARIAFTDVLSIGSRAVVLIVILIMAAFATAHLLGKIAKIPVRLATLIAMGASICGCSAIAAVAPVIKANEEEFSLAVAVTTLLGTTAVVLYPFIGNYFGFTDVFYGTWVGTSVHDTAQVLATGFAVSPTAGDTATVVKLTRNAFLGIVIVIVGITYARWVGGQIGGKKVPLLARVKQSFPLFLVGFLFLAVLNTLGFITWSSSVIGYDVQHVLGKVSSLLMLGALAGVGLGTNLGQIRKTGMMPVYVGVAVSATVALLSAALISVIGPTV